MLDNKLTDNEIIKALEICGTYKGKCTDCPAFVKVDRSNCKKVLLGALDLINRLQTENERLSNITRNLIGEIKAEAYTEFADKIKEHKYIAYNEWSHGEHPSVVDVDDIDDVLEEMVGGNE